MTRYDYNCPPCGEQGQVWATMKEMQEDKVEAPVCPKCGQRMKREFGVGDIKGSGGGWFGKSIDNLKAQSDERKRQGDGIRRETGLGEYNVKRNIH